MRQDRKRTTSSAHAVWVVLLLFVAMWTHSVAGSFEGTSQTTLGELKVLGDIAKPQISGSVHLTGDPLTFGFVAEVTEDSGFTIAIDFASHGTFSFRILPSYWDMTILESTVTDCTALENTALFGALQEYSQTATYATPGVGIAVAIYYGSRLIEDCETHIEQYSGDCCYFQDYCLDLCSSDRHFGDTLKDWQDGGTGYALGCTVMQSLRNYNEGRGATQSCDEPTPPPAPQTCSTQDECSPGFCCVGGLCQQCESSDTCEDNEDCAWNFCCASTGYCEQCDGDPECFSDRDCLPGWECWFGTCAPPF